MPMDFPYSNHNKIYLNFYKFGYKIKFIKIFKKIRCDAKVNTYRIFSLNSFLGIVIIELYYEKKKIFCKNNFAKLNYIYI